MQCSVCGAEAENLTSGEFDGVIVRCKRCGEYEVSHSAINEFLRLDYDERVAVLERVKIGAAPGERPAVTADALIPTAYTPAGVSGPRPRGG